MIALFIGTQELLIIALIVLLLFGGTQIPKLMRGLGKGVKSFTTAWTARTRKPKKRRKNKSSVFLFRAIDFCKRARYPQKAHSLLPKGVMQRRWGYLA